MNQKKDEKKAAGEHLKELKTRVLITLFVFIVGSVLGFAFHNSIEAIIQKPLGQTLYFSSPGGGLSFALQISMGVGLIAALPFALWHTAQFIKPAVKNFKTKSLVLFTASSIVLSVLAILYTYFISMPAALVFLVGFNSDSLQALIDVSDYMSFIFAYFIGTIIAFQFPLILLFINKIHRLPPGSLLKLQRPVILGIFIVAAVITPTVDPINHLLMAGPMMVLFELGVMLVWAINRKHRKKQKQAQQTQAATLFTPDPVSREKVAQSIKFLPGILQLETVFQEQFQAGRKSHNSNGDSIARKRSQVNTPARRLIVDIS